MQNSVRLRRVAFAIWWAGVCLTASYGTAFAADAPQPLHLQERLSASASPMMRDASERCETGDFATCWTIATSLFRTSKTPPSSATCALVPCDNREAAYVEMGCALARHACNGGTGEACASISEHCSEDLGTALLARLNQPASTDSETSEVAQLLVEDVTNPSTAPARASAGSEGIAVVVGWSDAEGGAENLDEALSIAVREQGFSVLPREVRLAPALFLQQERRDCDPWYLRELILHLDADLAVCASARGEQMNLTAASLRRDTTKFASLGGQTAGGFASQQLAAISLPDIVRPAASPSIVADLWSIREEQPLVALELPVSPQVSLGLRAAFWYAPVEPSPYLTLGAQARLYFNEYQDGLFLGAQFDVTHASYNDDYVSQSATALTPALAAGYRLDLPLHIVVTPKLEGLMRTVRNITDLAESAGRTATWSDAEFDARGTIEVGFKF